MAQIVTDAQGVATFTGAPGQYRFDVLPPAGYRDAADVTAAVVDNQQSNVDFSLQAQQGTAQVRVTNTATGAPVSGVTVEITAVVP